MFFGQFEFACNKLDGPRLVRIWRQQFWIVYCRDFRMAWTTPPKAKKRRIFSSHSSYEKISACVKQKKAFLAFQIEALKGKVERYEKNYKTCRVSACVFSIGYNFLVTVWFRMFSYQCAIKRVFHRNRFLITRSSFRD